MTVQSAGDTLGRDGAVEPRRLERYLTPLAIVLAVGAVFALAALTSSSFATKSNLIAVLRVASVTGIVCVCATSITLSGNFFSIALGQTAVLSAVLFAIVLRAHDGLVLALVVTFAAAILVGALQGAITELGANPIVVTLGASALLAGTSGAMTGSSAVDTPNSSVVNYLGSGSPLGIPTQTWTFAIVIVIVSLVARKFRLGRETLLTGANRATATGSGIGVIKVTIAAFVIASVGGAIVGIFQAAQFSQATTTTFTTLDFDVIAAILVGGTAAGGGEGSALRSALGGIFIALISNYMLLLGWPQGTITTVEGGLVILAVVAFHLIRHRPAGA